MTKKEQRKCCHYLMEVHKRVCFEHGDHPDEVDTPYSVGAEAIEHLLITNVESAID